MSGFTFCIALCCVVGLYPRLVPLSKALYHTCFIRGQGCEWWSRRRKLPSSVISDVKPIIYIYISSNYLEVKYFVFLVSYPSLGLKLLAHPPAVEVSICEL